MTEWERNDGSMRRGMWVTVSKILALADAKRERKSNRRRAAMKNRFSVTKSLSEDIYRNSS